MHVEHSIDINAEPGRVWLVMTDIERWPAMTAAVTRVEVLRPGPLEVGAEARITQPRFGTRTWRVTALDPGRSFSWESSGVGSRMVARHVVTPRGDSSSTATLSVDSSGWAVALIGWLLAGTGRRYIEMEAEGLKVRAESSSM